MKKLLTLLTGVLVAMSVISAQNTPDIKLHTSIFDKSGEDNYFTVTLGAASGCSGYVDVKCSGYMQFAKVVNEAYYSSDDYTLLGTNIPCSVDAEGSVEIYCRDGVVIDYICITGAEITSIEVKNPEAIEILSLEHNALQSLDLSQFTSLSALYLSDNPFDVSPLIVGSEKPNLMVLEISQVGNLDPNFDILTYESLQSFDAMGTYSLTKITPSGCPLLKRLSIDNTSVSTVDVSQNPELLILNVGESRVSELDLSNNTKLQQLFATHFSAVNTDCKFTSIDVSCCPDLIYLFVAGNNLTELDVTGNPLLTDLYASGNHLTGIDLSNNQMLVNVFLRNNDMDFNSLPIPQDTWLDYDLDQRPFAVPRSVKEGVPLDFSSKVVRPDATTLAAVVAFSDENPDIIYQVDESCYTFDEGVVTFNTVPTDSVFVVFANTLFPEVELTTGVFKVKSETDYGQDERKIVLTSLLTAGKQVQMYVGMSGASTETPKTFYVDLGDGVKTPFTATGSAMPEVPNVDTTKPSFGSMLIYVPQDETITAFGIKDITLSSINLDACHSLADLMLVNTQLKKLDLKWNRNLSHIEVTGNNFGSGFTLEGANGYFAKNVLRDICLSNNNMTDISLNEPYAWINLDLSNNKFEELNFTDADNLVTLDVSHNLLTCLKVNYCGELQTLNASYNQLDSLMYPENFNLKYVNIGNNRFTIKNMPFRNGLDEANFIYAPQAVIDIPEKGPGCSLRDQMREIDGKNTSFAWYDTDGNPLTEGIDYEINDGVTRFADSTIGKMLYCQVFHPAYPALSGADALRTTEMLSAGMPTNLLGSFTTPVGNQNVRLSIASGIENDALYIDWTGDNVLEQYYMTTTYTIYPATTTKNARVKVWSYDDDAQLSVFSVTGAKMADADFANMKRLGTFTLSGAGLSELALPESPDLTELTLDGNNFSSFDFGKYPKLTFVGFTGNAFTELDLTGLPNLQVAAFGNNRIATTKFNNPRLWALGLSNNEIESIDLSGVPAMEQLSLNYNKLSDIDLSNLHWLKALYLDHNRFDFATLPVPQESWILYTYGGQPEIVLESGGSVYDLSRNAERDGVESVYTWFKGAPVLDEDGYLTGELVDEGDYTVENGVTTFLVDIESACCVITNELFPRTYLVTNEVNVVSAGIESAVADMAVRYAVDGRKVTMTGLAAGAEVKMYNTDGSLVTRAKATSDGTASLIAPASGLYLIATPGSSAKLRLF